MIILCFSAFILKIFFLGGIYTCIFRREMEHLEKIDQSLFETYISEYYRYEFTVTYNPQYVYDIAYALSMTPYVLKDILDLGLAHSKIRRTDVVRDFYFNYVVEYHENGFPHIHGTLCLQEPLMPVNCKNWESKFYRKYGRTSVWATGKIDKMHNNDHFSGTWQEYLQKEGQTWCYAWKQQFVNNVERIIFHN